MMKRLFMLFLIAASGCAVFPRQSRNQDIADQLRIVCTLQKVKKTEHGDVLPLSAWIYNIGSTPVVCNLHPSENWSLVEDGERHPFQGTAACQQHPQFFRLLTPAKWVYDKMELDKTKQVLFHTGKLISTEGVGSFHIDCPLTDPIEMTNQTYHLSLRFRIFRNDEYDHIVIETDIDGDDLARRLANNDLQLTK
jgi:hypothetical protein